MRIRAQRRRPALGARVVRRFHRRPRRRRRSAHGIAGFVGILFIRFFASAAWNGVSDWCADGNAAQLGHQALAAVVAPVYAFTVTFMLLKLMERVMPLRTTQHDEALGMDVTQHGEEAYVTGEGAILITPDGGEDVMVADPGL